MLIQQAIPLSLAVLIGLAEAAIPQKDANPNVLPLRRRTNPSSASFPLLSTSVIGNTFEVEVTIGNQKLYLEVDTGSADIWVVEDGFQCINITTNEGIDQSVCNYGPGYSPANSSTFQPIPVTDEVFGIQFGSGLDTGTFGYETISLGNLSVPRQQFGLVNRTTDQVDGVLSGVLGLGYRSLTSGHTPSLDMSNDTALAEANALLLNRTAYNPFFNNLYETGAVAEDFFSIALERPPPNSSANAFGGYLALGTLPPVRHSPIFARTPVEIPDIPLVYTNNTAQITEWAIRVSSVSYSRAANASSPDCFSPAPNTTSTHHPDSGSSLYTNSTSFLAIPDTGLPLLALPIPLAAEINALFTPAATLVPASSSGQAELYTVPCTALPPTLGFTIGGETFFVDPVDLVTPVLGQDGVCLSNVAGFVPTELSGGLGFLGVPFLRNVVAVFDFGRGEVRFAGRE